MYITDPNAGWNAGARSKQVCFGDCVSTFSVPTNVAGVVCGLSGSDREVGFREIEYALYFSRALNVPSVCVYERGVQKTSVVAYVAEDIFSVRRVGTVVQYLQNSTILYTSAAPSTGPVFLDSSLYMAGDEIR